MTSADQYETQHGDSPEKVIKWIYEKLKDTDSKVIIAHGWCKKCGVCIYLCPVKALERGKDGYPKVDNRKCISCGTCEISCPDFAMTVTKLKSRKK